MKQLNKETLENIGALEYLIKQVSDETLKQRLQKRLTLLEETLKQNK